MRLALILAGITAASTVAAQQPAPRAAQQRPATSRPAAAAAARALSPIEQRMQAVERSLLPSIRIRGRPLANMTIAARMKKHGVAGVSVAVINDFRIEWARGYGVVGARRTPIDTATAFPAGTAGQPVVAAVALLLSQNKKLDLDKDANKSLKSWKIPKSELTKSKAVTPRSLLSHMSGLPVVPLDHHTAESVPTLRQLLEPLELEQIPTLEYRRHGADYLVLEQLLADAGKRPFADLATELVLAPLSMTRSTFGPPLPAAFSLTTTPSDLARFALEIQNAGAGRTGRAFKQQTAQLMMTPPAYGPEGLGLVPSSGDSALRFTQRGGTAESDVEMVAFVNHGQGAVVMAQRGPGSGLLIAEILNSIARTYGWLEYLPAEKVVAHVDPRVYDRYAGRYAAGDRTGTISKRGTKLLFVVGKTTTELIPESVSDFFTPDGDATYSFVFDEHSKVSAMTVRRREGDTRWDRR